MGISKIGQRKEAVKKKIKDGLQSGQCRHSKYKMLPGWEILGIEGIQILLTSLTQSSPVYTLEMHWKILWFHLPEGITVWTSLAFSFEAEIILIFPYLLFCCEFFHHPICPLFVSIEPFCTNCVTQFSL